MFHLLNWLNEWHKTGAPRFQIPGGEYRASGRLCGRCWVTTIQNTTAMQCWVMIRLNFSMMMNAEISVRPLLSNCSGHERCIKTCAMQSSTVRLKLRKILSLKLGFIYTDCTEATERSLLQGCTKLGCQVARATFRTVAPDLCGDQKGSFFIAPRWFPMFGKSVHPRTTE